MSIQQVSTGDLDLDNQSFANSTRSNISQFSKSGKDDKNSSWFKSLKRNLSSKRRGKFAKSGGNIATEESVRTPGRLIKSEWDICGGGNDEGYNESLEIEFNNLHVDSLGVVSGLDLAHRQYDNLPTKGN